MVSSSKYLTPISNMENLPNSSLVGRNRQQFLLACLYFPPQYLCTCSVANWYLMHATGSTRSCTYRQSRLTTSRNTLKMRQKRRHLTDDIFNFIVLKDNPWPEPIMVDPYMRHAANWSLVGGVYVRQCAWSKLVNVMVCSRKSWFIVN